MTDNPYAAPESVSHGSDASEHVRAVRRVAKIFRVLGWILFAGYGTVAVGGLLLSIYVILFWGNERFFNPSSATIAVDRLYMLAMVAGYAGMSFVGWLCIRTGKKLLNKQKSAYRDAIFLSCLMLLIFPLMIFGVYAIGRLRKHWRPYCQELAESSAGPDSP